MVRTILAWTAVAYFVAACPAIAGPAAPIAVAKTAAPAAGPSGYRWWVTTRDLAKRLTSEDGAASTPAAADSEAVVDVDTGHRLQRIDGFGAAFTDSSAWLLHGLPAARRAVVMRDLFGGGSGIALNLMRVPIGASDFTRTGPWSLAEGRQPATLPRFSTHHDDAYIIPVLREAQRVNPAMLLFASPWSAPAWMKTNGSMLGTWKHTTLRPDAYNAFATYFVRFLKDYGRKGVKVWGLTMQNEPNQDPASYPGMYLSPADQSRFIADHLAPALAAAGLSPTILAGDASTADPRYLREMLRDPRLRPLVGATAWHCYQGLGDFGKGLAELSTMVPDRSMYVSECSTGPGGHIAGDTTEKTMVALANGAGGMVLWNLALDPAGGPKMGVGCERCTGLVTIDPKTRRYDYTLNYYQLGQFSRFVQPGAYRLASSDGGGVWAQAFRNPDGSLVVVAYNSADNERNVTIRFVDGKPVSVQLAGHATGTLVRVP